MKLIVLLIIIYWLLYNIRIQIIYIYTIIQNEQRDTYELNKVYNIYIYIYIYIYIIYIYHLIFT